MGKNYSKSETWRLDQLPSVSLHSWDSGYLFKKAMDLLVRGKLIRCSFCDFLSGTITVNIHDFQTSRRIHAIYIYPNANFPTLKNPQGPFNGRVNEPIFCRGAVWFSKKKGTGLTFGLQVVSGNPCLFFMIYPCISKVYNYVTGQEM